MIKKRAMGITAVIYFSISSILNAQRPLPLSAKPSNEKPQEISKENQAADNKQSPSKGWILSSGLARDIGIGGNGEVYVIGNNPRAGGYGIWRLIKGNEWQEIGGGAVRIDVDDKGIPWVVNSIGQIFKREGNEWRLMPGLASDIGIGADGSVWIIGTNIVHDGGFGIWKWTGKDWMTFDGAALKIDVDRNGDPWVISAYGDIFKRENSSWKMIGGKAKDIGIGADGSVFIIGTNPCGGGYGIWKWNGSSWNEIGGGAVCISVDESGNPWVINSGDNIFRWGNKEK
jgi:hypothetical protein